jgi:hypothetical protein
MATYTSNGKELIDVEYDDIVEVNDIVDGMRVLSKDIRDEEYAVFMLEKNGNICCYVFDEVFIIARVSGFENLIDAIEAWNNNEI